MLWGQQHPTESWANGMLWGQQHPTEGAGQGQVIPTHILAKVTGLSPWFTSSSISLFPITLWLLTFLAHFLRCSTSQQFPQNLTPTRSETWSIWIPAAHLNCSPSRLKWYTLQAHMQPAHTHCHCSLFQKRNPFIHVVFSMNNKQFYQ